MIFSRVEYEGRLRAVRARMFERGIDVLVLDQTEHLAWVAGWHASGSLYHACLVPLDGEPVMVLRRLDEPVFRERSWLGDCVLFADCDDAVEVVATTLARRGWAAARNGVELDSHYLMYTSARGMAFSETVLVTEGGPERLTRLDRQLFVR